MKVITVTTDLTKRNLTCARCGISWIAEAWRDDDGPCRNGKWYCVGCVSNDDCGCLGGMYRDLPWGAGRRA